MKNHLFLFIIFAVSTLSFGQENAYVKGKIVNAADDEPMEM